MATSIGPLYAVLASAPAEWNEFTSSQLVLRTSQGLGWAVEVFSKGLRSALADGVTERWVYLAQVIREDGEALYAFETARERALFIELREIDAIGSKYAGTAVAELGLAGLGKLLDGGAASVLALGKVPGLGPKTLERLVTGLRAKRENFARLLSGPVVSAGGGGQARMDFSVPTLLLQALGQVGLKPQETVRLYRELMDESERFGTLGTGDQVKLMLSRWGQGKSRKGTSAET